MNILDIANAVSSEAQKEIVGIRPGEKLHEQMIGAEDAPFTFEYDEYFKILPMINDWFSSKDRIKGGVLVSKDFTYSSENNSEWMSVEELREWIRLQR